MRIITETILVITMEIITKDIITTTILIMAIIKTITILIRIHSNPNLINLISI